MSGVMAVAVMTTTVMRLAGAGGQVQAEVAGPNDWTAVPEGRC